MLCLEWKIWSSLAIFISILALNSSSKNSNIKGSIGAFKKYLASRSWMFLHPALPWQINKIVTWTIYFIHECNMGQRKKYSCKRGKWVEVEKVKVRYIVYPMLHCVYLWCNKTKGKISKTHRCCVRDVRFLGLTEVKLNAQHHFIVICGFRCSRKQRWNKGNKHAVRINLLIAAGNMFGAYILSRRGENIVCALQKRVITYSQSLAWNTSNIMNGVVPIPGLEPGFPAWEASVITTYTISDDIF